MRLRQLALEELEHWAHDAISGEPFPAYWLAAPAEASEMAAGLAPQVPSMLGEGGAEVLETDPRSGAISLVVASRPSAAGRRDVPDAQSLLLEACQQIDPREYEVRQEPAPAFAEAEELGDGADAVGVYGQLEISSRLEGYPVLGPGGGAIFSEGAGRLYGTITVRQRIGVESAEGWRMPRLVEDLAESSPAEGGSIDLFADFGYFELSNREEQSLLRPVFMFVLEHEADPDDDGDVGWRRVFVEPATELGGIPPQVGIEQWYEPERWD